MILYLMLSGEDCCFVMFSVMSQGKIFVRIIIKVLIDRNACLFPSFDKCRTAAVSHVP